MTLRQQIADMLRQPRTISSVAHELKLTRDEVELVRKRLESTHWKRRLPTVAMLSQTAIGEYYLRPVDF